MVVVGLGIFMMGAVGLAVDGSHLYVQRQLAQAAADAGAQAGMMSVLVGTNVGGTHAFSVGTGSPFTHLCGTTDQATPCFYAQSLNGFNTGAGDRVTYVGNPSGISVAGLSPTFPVNLLQVTVQRDVPATLMGLLGWNTMTVSATGVAAIVYVDSPVPIIVTHPTKSGALNLGGTGTGPKIKICGGPAQSIQVNSTNATAITWTGNPTVDLSKAGPADAGNCVAGTGASFGVAGGPSGSNALLQCTGTQVTGCVDLGTTGFFIDPSPAILDPLAGVTAPPDPTVVNAMDLNPMPVAVMAGVNGCPAASGGCTLYFPGKYSGAMNDIKVKNQTALFAPGIYYMYGTNFTLDSNGNPYMAVGLPDNSSTGTPGTGNCCGTATGWTQNMLIYMTGPTAGATNTIGVFSVNANAGDPGSFLIGSPNGSAYKGIFLFVDRNAATQTHSIDGGAQLQITGTLYMTSANNSATVYQILDLQGNGGGTTKLTGEIIASTLDMQGTPGIVMNLNSTVAYKLNKVALIQ
jgi:hypothetical protein